MNLLTGPPGSGKTTKLLSVARDAARRGERVWWVGLPSQRTYVYRRLADEGAVLGLEFLSSQQVYYRLLAHALKLKPLVVGTGRIALVGEALKKLRNELPSPGEARLFTRSIAEAKRFGLTWREVRAFDEETARFRAVLRVYEELKGEAWDYDDFRLEALHLARSNHLTLEPDLIIVDGFREVGPLELELYKALSQNKKVGVWLSLPDAPPGEVASEEVARATACKVETHRAPNPVFQSRWLLRALKRDLASGYDALDLAVILPEREVRAFLSLADEYGVPLMDETPKALAETPPGRLLLDLLELPDYPTASRLLAIPELAPLAKAALKRGVAGREALTLLAQEVGESASWRAWLARLDVPDGELAWAQDLVESLPEFSVKNAERFDWGTFKNHALERAKEAAQLAKGAQFRAWWGALLQETALFSRPKGGVALLTAKLASGRRFRRVYLAHAVEGAYTVGEAEDYFTPEEGRGTLEAIFALLSGSSSGPRSVTGLPKRFLGRDRALFAELLTRGDEVVVTYPEADQGGPLVPELALVGEACTPLPEVAAGSRLELGSADSFAPVLSRVALGSPHVQALSRYAECGFRYWAERRVEDQEVPWWRALVRELRERRKLGAARLDALKASYPEAAAWLAQSEGDLLPLTFGVALPERHREGQGGGPFALLDAAGRSGTEMRLYTFLEPGAWSREDAEGWLRRPHRWNELWAAGHLLDTYGGRISGVRLYVWPVLGEPIDVFGAPIAYVWRQIASRRQKAERAFARFSAGDVTPKPGFVCRECRVFDLCRVGQR